MSSSSSHPRQQPVVHQPADYERSFDADAYFEFYFGKKAISDGTRVSLFALPMFAKILEQQLRPEERKTMIDIGAGPTVYSLFCLRHTITSQVYLADFVDRNLDALKAWRDDQSQHDWEPVIRVILRTEGVSDFSSDSCDTVQRKSRELLKAGDVLYCNVLDKNVCPTLPQPQVDVLVSIFCLESACSDYAEYCRALTAMTSLLRPGGRLILGSVLEDNTYNSGGTTIFHLLSLTLQEIESALEAAGLDTVGAKKYVMPDEGVMFLMAAKKQ